jgi:dTDP-4-dehydrorhamnose reductase
MEKLNILVLGDGLLGGEIIKQTNWDCVSRKKSNFDISKIEESIPKKKYDIILNCIANTNTYSDDKDLHWKVNYVFVDNLIDYCNSKNIKLVHISTDYLYTNSKNNACEEDVPVHCNNWYGYTKLLSDALVQLRSKNYLICRCTHKPIPFPYDSAWIDQIGNFDYVDEISRLIIKSINLGLSGVYNIGTETKTMLELAEKTRKVKKIFSPINTPKNTTMDLEKFKKNTEEFPFLSIAIPTYGYDGNGTELLEFNFNKLSIQKFKDFEVVISDHSIDNTIKDVCEKWKDKLNIKHSFNDRGRGVISPNINEVMKKCKGEWIKILFQDDFLYDENSLKNQYDFIINKENLTWFVTEFFHTADGVNFFYHYFPRWNDLIWTGLNTMGCPSGITIKNKDLIFFDEDLNWLMDCDYYKKMYDKFGEPDILNKITVVNRTSGSRLTNTTSQEIKDRESVIVHKRYEKTF